MNNRYEFNASATSLPKAGDFYRFTDGFAVVTDVSGTTVQLKQLTAEEGGLVHNLIENGKFTGTAYEVNTLLSSLKKAEM